MNQAVELGLQLQEALPPGAVMADEQQLWCTKVSACVTWNGTEQHQQQQLRLHQGSRLTVWQAQLAGNDLVLAGTALVTAEFCSIHRLWLVVMLCGRCRAVVYKDECTSSHVYSRLLKPHVAAAAAAAVI
jgi:hypothetical protein